MYRFFYIILVLVFFPTAVNANDYFSIEDDIQCIKSQYINVVNNVVGSQNKYTTCFPKDFRKYSAIFGYGGGGYERNTYLGYDAIKYVDLFFKIETTEGNYEDILSIGLYGHWEVDGVDYYKYKLKEVVKGHKKEIAKVLSSYSDAELFSFFFFYFDNESSLVEVPDEISDLISLEPSLKSAAESLINYFKQTSIDSL